MQYLFSKMDLWCTLIILLRTKFKSAIRFLINASIVTHFSQFSELKLQFMYLSYING